MPKRISGHALFHAAFRFAVLILFLVTFVLLFPLWRGLERGGEAAALVYSSTRHGAKFNLAVAFLPFRASRSHSGINITIAFCPNLTGMACVFVFNDTSFQRCFSAEMLASATILA